MRTLTTHVRDCSDGVPRNFVLHVEVPLLNVWPRGFRGNGIHAERKLSLRLAASRIAAYVIPLRGVRQWRWVFQGFRVVFISTWMLEKEALSGTDGPFSVSSQVLCRTDTQGRGRKGGAYASQ